MNHITGALPPTPPEQTTSRAWTPDQLVAYPLIEHVELAPDGAHILYTVRRPHTTEEESEFRRTIYLVAVTPNGPVAPRALTHNADAAQPRWSPDGRYIAFLRPIPATGKAGIWIMPVDGGEAWPITGPDNDIRHPVTRFQWRPDGRAIAFTAQSRDAEREAKSRARNDAWRWRHDYRRVHLHLVEVTAPGAPLAPVRRLSATDQHVQNFAWRPDGQELAFVHQPTPYLDSWTAARLVTVAPDQDGAPLHDRGEVGTWEAHLAYSPDGAWLACAVGEPEHRWPYACRVHLYGTDPVMPPRALADVSDGQARVLGWRADGAAVLVRDDQGLGVAVLALPVDGDPAHTVIAADHLITVAHVNTQGALAYVREEFHTPQHIVVVTVPVDGPVAPVVVTAPPAPLGPLPQIQVLQRTTPDGLTVEGVLYLPADYDPAAGARIPLLLHIHGGPAGVFQRQYAGTPYYYPPAALCEQGIALLRCNPRGSSGYGRDFRFANVEDWGGGDFRDLMQMVDAVIEAGIADPERLGICGWSYGGYMTSWSITQTHRFKAASIGAPVTNLVSFIGTSDIPGFIPGYFGGEIWERGDLLHARSPLYQVHKARTPALVQHGEADERVPLEQGLQYAMGLERNGIPVETILYPRQGHAISEPRLLMDAIARNLAWFGARLASNAP